MLRSTVRVGLVRDSALYRRAIDRGGLALREGRGSRSYRMEACRWLGAYGLDGANHGAQQHRICRGAVRVPQSDWQRHHHASRCAVGTRCLCLLSPRSIFGITATTPGCAGGRCAATSVVVDRRRDGDRRRVVVDRGPDLDTQDCGSSLYRHTACHQSAGCGWGEHPPGRTDPELYRGVTCHYRDFLAAVGRPRWLPVIAK